MKVQARTKGTPAVPAHKGKDGKDVAAQPAIPARGPITVDYPLLDVNTTAELVKNFGEAVTFNAAKSATVISLQAFVRRLLDKNTDPAEIQKQVSAWRPDVRSMVKMSAFEKAQSTIKSLSPEEKKKLLAELQGK